MISPMTPPGTKVVCIKATDQDLVIGATYTVRAMVESILFPGMFLVQLDELDHSKDIIHGERSRGFKPDRFRRVDLPSCLTDILNRAPIKQTEHV